MFEEEERLEDYAPLEERLEDYADCLKKNALKTMPIALKKNDLKTMPIVLKNLNRYLS